MVSHDENWNWDAFHHHLPVHVLEHIVAVKPPSCSLWIDRPCWMTILVLVAVREWKILTTWCDIVRVLTRGLLEAGLRWKVGSEVESWNSLSPNLKRLCVSCNYSCCFFSVTKVASTWQQTETKLRLVVVVRDF
ncbi:hypothetical protein V6N11_061831 [Hibiscus sabdariffa]|uniref:Uncharacterized protein n=1 Tax=Hibiscus sabdariffa TaxID=183260 RepID=A0ABR1ZAZ0_9ROSI